MLTTGTCSRLDWSQVRTFPVQNVRLEPGGGQGHGADGGHHPRHPRQHLPGAQRPEQVGAVREVGRGDNRVVFPGVQPSSSWRISNMVMIPTSKIF